MKRKPFLSAALLLLPIPLLWGGKLYREKTAVSRTGIDVSWMAFSYALQPRYVCGDGATLLVRRVSDGKWMRQMTFDACQCTVNVPAGKYEVIVNHPQIGSSTDSDDHITGSPKRLNVVEVREGRIAEMKIQFNTLFDGPSVKSEKLIPPFIVPTPVSTGKG